MITVRGAAARGRGFYGWLETRHTFSFGEYYDPAHMGFSALRVINDDIVQPSSGFDTHGHRDMEIISFVLQGQIAHRDSEGNEHVLPAGQFQLMSAGRGIYHSEYNASDSEELRLLQIWIRPESSGGAPGYQQKDFGQQPGLTPVVTPTGEQGTLQIKQDATVYQLILAPDSEVAYMLSHGRKLYVHQAGGTLSLDSVELNGGDGAMVEGEESVTFANRGSDNVTALVFDLP
jgi:redox-sensitive bicupin YhaK (pirin superfamily)